MSQHDQPQSQQTPAHQLPQPQSQPQPSSPSPQHHHQQQQQQPPPPELDQQQQLHQQQQQLQQQTTPQQQTQQPPPTPGQSASPPLRKDTNSSISTQATTASAVTNMSADTSNTSYSADTSPNLTSIFHVKDGSDVSNRVRASRRRTGPLSQQQREKAALIRKLGACIDCRRRRVACHPSHHNMTWEDAVRKYHRSHSPSIQDIAPSLSAQRPLSPAPVMNNNVKPMYSQDPGDMMEIDSPTPPGQHRLSESRIRTPLPSGPRLDKLPTLPGLEGLKSDLQNNVSRILSNPSRSRYASAQALLLYWQDDPDLSVGNSVKELGEVFDQFYRYTFSITTIPSSSEACKSPWRWLSRKITDFVEDRDQRDVLKIVYYNGHSYLDGNREMVLASSKDKDKAETIRWSGIQQVLEEACSDTLIIMDAAFFPSSKMHRQQGVLELIAAAVSEEHFDALDRCTFTRVLTDHLRTRASQRYISAFSAAELHSKLLSNYPSLVQDKNPEKETITSFPSPLHMQISGNANLPSILLAPLNIGASRTSLPFGGTEGQQLILSMRIGDEPIDVDSWTEWLRMMPDGIKDVRVEGPYRPSR
ncbi:hypothetical protein CkaCkLH20_05548 [Colletotrichum karsti]|uniref:Tyrosine-protein phosphatase non-receptor type 6 n=1 Tax=Colletotrichum karsti TaxID=1095194 RepID=A0A9P6I4C1_9PEZI|nr:uncharacterized protein CkaCkLH20_05548 [Colletotrichum karsti]KAF9876702.1 hypothetical protein CkaCkLH20_05548 [Colletotrichum karsti]